MSCTKCVLYLQNVTHPSIYFSLPPCKCLSELSNKLKNDNHLMPIFVVSSMHPLYVVNCVCNSHFTFKNVKRDIYTYIHASNAVHSLTRTLFLILLPACALVSTSQRISLLYYNKSNNFSKVRIVISYSPPSSVTHSAFLPSFLLTSHFSLLTLSRLSSCHILRHSNGDGRETLD